MSEENIGIKEDWRLFIKKLWWLIIIDLFFIYILVEKIIGGEILDASEIFCIILFAIGIIFILVYLYRPKGKMVAVYEGWSKRHPWFIRFSPIGAFVIAGWLRDDNFLIETIGAVMLSLLIYIGESKVSITKKQ